MTIERTFVPALGWHFLTPLYDPVIRMLTRERLWRTALVEQIDPRPGQTILDVGCGTGSLAILLKQAQPLARMVGLDPDANVLARAAAKASSAGVEIEWRQGFARDAAGLGTRFDKSVSSMVFHQVPLEEKRAGLEAMAEATASGGEVHIADFARQRRALMRALFRLVGQLDGSANTRPNADGALERIIGEIAPAAAEPTRRFATPLGEISLFRIPIPTTRLRAGRP